MTVATSEAGNMAYVRAPHNNGLAYAVANESLSTTKCVVGEAAPKTNVSRGMGSTVITVAEHGCSRVSV